jgi:hypothetical protein
MNFVAVFFEFVHRFTHWITGLGAVSQEMVQPLNGQQNRTPHCDCKNGSTPRRLSPLAKIAAL